MKQTREEFLKDPQPIMLEDFETNEEKAEFLSFIFQRPVKIENDRVIMYKTKEEEEKNEMS